MSKKIEFFGSWKEVVSLIHFHCYYHRSNSSEPNYLAIENPGDKQFELIGCLKLVHTPLNV